MFLDNNKRIICLSVPKTGSTTCSSFFRENIKYTHKFYDAIYHSTPKELENLKLLIHPLEEFTIYGIIRCPIERFISAVNDCVSLKSKLIIGSCTTKNDLICLIDRVLFRDFNLFSNEHTVIFKPQSHWLRNKNTIVYNYNNLNQFVKNICEIYDIDFNKFNVFERRKVGVIPVSADDLDPETRNKILELYAEDQEMYDKTSVINT